MEVSMAIKNAAASAILALMFASLLVIYVVVPQNDLVTFLSVVIMGIGLVIAFVGEREEIMMMAGLAGIISLAAAFFAGQSVFGNIGGIVATVAWAAALIALARRASAETVVIPEDHAFMVAPFLSSQAYANPSSIPLTSLPFLDRHVATIPIYELTEEIKVTNVDVRSGDEIDDIEVHTRYQVIDPPTLLRGIPNRGKIQSDIAKEMGVTLSKARLDVAFWEKLLARQMRAEVDDIVRKEIFKKGAAQSMVIAYEEREELSVIVQAALQELVRRWGVQIHEIALDSYKLDRMAMKRIKAGPDAFEKEILVDRKRREGVAASEATRIQLTGQASNERIRQLVELLKDRYPNMNSEQIAVIVSSALLGDSLDQDSEYEKLLMAPGQPAQLPAPKK
jgi:SPFH domain / Band 7 family